ncbi:MAG: DNA/RNA nuclease SfsA [Planctomycetota bacterium]|nr:DNA/RNA nuclease SfsA [Planctomycetota bacterium]
MHFDEPPIEGRLIERYKRFLADVELSDGSVITAHCPNTGSLLGCKEPGSRVWLRDSHNPGRKLRYTWQAVEVDGTWVNVDTSLPNRVVFDAIQERRIRPLAGYPWAKREVKYGQGSRIDILLTKSNGERCYVEVKSTTLTDGRLGLFPDAVTARGKKHLQELVRMTRKGHRAVQLFLVGRADVTRFRPADAIDPAYCKELRRAAAKGVEVLAYRTRVEPDRLEVDRKLPVDLR